MKKLFVLSLMILLSDLIFAHCDTMDGPVIADARKAIEQNNVNYVLKWVPSPNEGEEHASGQGKEAHGLIQGHAH